MATRRAVWSTVGCLALLAALFAGAGAQVPAHAASQDVAPLALTPFLAVSRALENDPNARLAEIAFEEAKIAYERSKASNLLSASRYDRESAEINFLQAKRGYDDELAQVAVDTLDLYTTVLANEQDVLLKEKQLRSAEIRLEKAKQLAAVDSAGPLDVLDAQVDVESAKISLRSARNTLEHNRVTLARKLGLEGALFALEGVEAPPLPEYSLEAIEADAVAQSPTVESRANALRLREINLEQVRASGAAHLDLRAAELEVEAAKLELSQAAHEVRQSVRQSYAGLLAAWSQLEIEAARLTAQEQKYEITQRQHAAGLRTDAELLEGEISLGSVRMSHFSAVREYIRTLLSFQRLIGEPPALGGVSLVEVR